MQSGLTDVLFLPPKRANELILGHTSIRFTGIAENGCRSSLSFYI